MVFAFSPLHSYGKNSIQKEIFFWNPLKQKYPGLTEDGDFCVC